MNSVTAPFMPANDSSRRVDDPRWEIRAGLITSALFLGCFVGWAAFVRLDAAAVAPGIVKVSGERKSIQSLTGGIISGINVAEGAQVRAGQVLVRFANVEAVASESALARQVIGLEAEIARLNAQRTGVAKIETPAEFATLPAENKADADAALAAEQQELNVIRDAAAAKRATLGQRIAQIGSQISGYEIKQRSLERQSAYNQQEMSSVEPLVSKGYATMSRLLALKRSAAGLDGDSGSAQAEAASLRNAAGEARMQILEIDSDLAETTAKQLHDAQTSLDTALPQWQAAREKLAQTALRAPVTGHVVGLAIHTIGGVASPGAVLMDVVPDDRSLTVEAEVSVSDANELSVGQEARVRVTSLHGRQIPVLKGRLTRVSADSIIDQKTGRAFYSASVQVPRSELDNLSRAAGIAAIRPGTQVEVQVSLRQRSALGYWLEPITQIFSHSLTER